MNPGFVFAAAQAGSSIASGLAGSAASKQQARNQELQAFVAGTQTLQRDTIARDDLQRSLGTIRAARGANNLGARSANAREIEMAAIDTSDRDRQIQRSDGRIREANLLSAAAQSRSNARLSLLTGAVRASVPIAQYYSGI